MKQSGVNEELKATDQMKWVGLMNTLKAQAEVQVSTTGAQPIRKIVKGFGMLPNKEKLVFRIKAP